MERVLTEKTTTEITSPKTVDGPTQKPRTITNEESPKKLKGTYVPNAETSTHRAMFSFYSKLGKTRSLPKVAKEFGKSISFISTLSRAFRWQERVRQAEAEIKDPVVVATIDRVDSSRTKIILVIDDVADTLHELTLISKKIKAGEIEDGARVGILLKALNVFGIQVRSPKDLRDLISVLKDAIEFNQGAPPAVQKTEIQHVERLLIVKGLD